MRICRYWIIISEAQNEDRDSQRWGFDIIPYRVVMKTGFQTPDSQRLGVEDAFNDRITDFVELELAVRLSF
jgi:type I restriction enzyme R subunit